MKYLKHPRSIKFILFSLLLLPIFACIDIEFMDMYEKFVATLETIEETAEKYLIPITNLTIQPGKKSGDILLSWSHPLGDELNYDLFIYDSPITEENWHNVNVIHLKSRDINFTKEENVYNMDYTLKSLPLRKKHWIIVRQSIKGAKEIQVLLEAISSLSEIEIPEELWQIPPSVLPPSNMLSLIDNGIRPDPDGFVFKNESPKKFKYPVSKQGYIEMLRWVYGDDDVCATVKSGECKARKAAEKFAKILLKGGQCSGFTTTAGRFYLGLTEMWPYTPLRTIDIVPTSNIFKLIMAYHQLQAQEIIKKSVIETRTSDLLIQLEKLENVMLDPLEIPNLGIHPNKKKCPGHSVLPYMIVQDGKTWANVWVYDNNYPELLTKVVIYDLNNKTWTYEFSPGNIWESSKPANQDNFCGSIGHSNVSDYLSVENGDYIGRSYWMQENVTTISNTSSKILISSSNQSLIGFTSESEIINNFTDAYINVIDEEGTMVMHLPEDDYTIFVNNDSSDDSGFILTGDKNVYSFDSIAKGDTISITKDQVEYKNNQKSIHPEISIIFEEQNRSSSFNLQPNLNSGQPVFVKYDKSFLNFEVSSTAELDYALSIDIISDEGSFHFQNVQVEQEPEHTFFIRAEEIVTNEDSLIISVDSNRDDAFDQVIEIENQFDGDSDELDEHDRSTLRSKIIFIIIGVIAAIGILVGLIFWILNNQAKQRRERPRYIDRTRNNKPGNRNRNRHSRNRSAKSRNYPRARRRR